MWQLFPEFVLFVHFSLKHDLNSCSLLDTNLYHCTYVLTYVSLTVCVLLVSCVICSGCTSD